MPVSHLNTSTTSLFASAVASLTDYTYSPLTQSPAQYLATVLSGLTGDTYSHLTTPEHRLLALIATELSGSTVSQLTSSRAEMLAAIVNNPPEEGESVLEEIDEAGNTEITEYVNNDVTAVTGNVDCTEATALATFSTPNLTTALALLFGGCSSLASFVAALETVTEDVNFTGTLLTNFNQPLLTLAGNVNISNNANLATMMLSGLTMTGNLAGSSNPVLETVDISALETATGFVDFTNCALSETSVDAILERLAAMDGTNGTTLWENLSVDLSGGTNSPPSATGLTAKTTLEGRGNTVTVNVDTAPSLSNPDAAETGTTTADLQVDTNEANGTLYWVVTESGNAPSATNVKDGLDDSDVPAADNGSQAVSATGQQNISGGATGLVAATTYWAHFMHEDAATNQSDVSSSESFETNV